jgi:outer membrane protein TolC
MKRVFWQRISIVFGIAALLAVDFGLPADAAPKKRKGKAKTKAAPKKQVTEKADVHPIDLATVLRLANAQNLEIQIARERLAEARANETSALWQFFPWLSPGISYRHHEGRVQAVDGAIFDASKQSYTHGITLNAQVEPGEAYFRSLAARQLTKAADNAVITRNLEAGAVAAQAYFDLLFAQASAQVAAESIRISTNYQAQVEQAVEAGIAFRGDALRVKIQGDRNRLILQQAEEQQKIASSRLAQILNLEPTVQLAGQNGELVPLTLNDAELPLRALVQQALGNRPELKESKASRDAAEFAKQGAVYGPMIPSVNAQTFLGGLGGGTGGSFGNDGDQQDYFLGLSWRIGPGGLFDGSRIKATEARARGASLAVEKVQDEISRQVVESAVRIDSLRQQMATAKSVLETAEAGLQMTRQRREFAVGVVLENIQAEQDLTRARLDYLKAIAEFNKTQYALNRALGKP